MTVEWACEGCGFRVIALGMDRRPSHQLCAMCVWLCEFVPDPEEMWQAYTRLRTVAAETWPDAS